MIANIYLVTLRMLMSFIMLWSFFDKLFGYGFSTKPESAWIAGGSPTSGFLSNAIRGPFEGFFSSLAGNPFIDWLFMIGLLLIGLSLLVGVGLRIGGYSGALFMFIIYLSVIPPTTNPIIDNHIVYSVVFLLIGVSQPMCKYDYLRNWWISRTYVKEWMK